ncbi:MAG: TRAP transporter large permease [Chloroflexi bacterium]|jgi:tripartite ATP-independent transporter DctM subunit|nr:TRAP transporter large permease [Chloroflexota bacterium]
MIGPFGLLAGGLLFGAPIAFALLAAALLYYLVSPIPDVIVVQRMVSGIESFPLLAVPLFVLTGTVMARGGIATRLLDFADGLVGHMKGGLGQVNVMNSVLMGGMSGSANADAAIDAKVLVPVMVKKGYSRDFASALSAATGVITPILPPGIGLIIYGLIAQVSIGRLFIAGIVPGIMLAIGLMIVVRIIAGRRGYGAQRGHMVGFGELLRLARRAFWALMMPVLLIVGLRLGVFTPTELGAVAAVYALLVGVVIHREIPIREIPAVFREAVLTSSVVMLIIAAAAAFGAVISIERVPQAFVSRLVGITENPLLLLLVINVGLMLLGTVLEGTSILVILTPILAPVGASLGVDPVQFGVVIVLNLTIGALTPPVGTVLYTVCSITGSTVKGYTREIWPLLLALVAVLLLITYVPAFTLTLPDLVYE